MVIRAGAPVEPWVGELLEKAGWPPPEVVKELAGGRNNRVFRIDTSRGPCFLKIYFREPSDSRDRLAHEYSLLEACEQVGVGQVPRPLGRDLQRGAALYEFVPGHRPSTMGEEEIRQAAGFLEQLNSARDEKAFRALPSAAEACFSVSEHIASVDRRIDRLGNMENQTSLDRAAREWVKHSLLPAWQATRADTAANRGTDEGLRPGLRIVSPSDFGIHNCLRRDDGCLVFLDFEYAGWDDPAKLVCDLANQPDQPLTPAQATPFVRRLLGWLKDEEFWKVRFRLLAPVYQLKWACIVLNDFLPYGRNRRAFQQAASEEIRRKEIQLEKAKEMLSRARQGLLPFTEPLG